MEVVLFVVFLIIVFFVLVHMFRRIIYTNISSATRHLDEINRDYIKKEEEAQKKLEEADRIYEETVTKAKEEALQMREDILKQAEQQKKTILEQAQRQSEEMIQQGEKTRHFLISEFEKKIEIEAIKHASGLLGDVLPQEVRQKIHSVLVKDLLEGGFQRLDKLQISQEVDEVQVVSAFDLGEEEKKSLGEILKRTLHKECAIKEEIDPELISGFMVKLGDLVIDGSLQFKIKEKAKALVQKKNE